MLNDPPCCLPQLSWTAPVHLPLEALQFNKAVGSYQERTKAIYLSIYTTFLSRLQWFYTISAKAGGLGGIEDHACTLICNFEMMSSLYPANPNDSLAGEYDKALGIYSSMLFWVLLWCPHVKRASIRGHSVSCTCSILSETHCNFFSCYAFRFDEGCADEDYPLTAITIFLLLFSFLPSVIFHVAHNPLQDQ